MVSRFLRLVFFVALLRPMKNRRLTCKAATLTPPLPCTKTQSPFFVSLPFKPIQAFHAVKPEQVSVAACSKLKVFGARTRHDSGKIAYCVRVPLTCWPIPVLMDDMVGNFVGPIDGTRCVITLSPVLQEETEEPVRKTLPEPSEPGIKEGERGKVSALCGFVRNNAHVRVIIGLLLL